MVKHSNNLSAVADELCECVWPFCVVGPYMANNKRCTVSRNFLKFLTLLFLVNFDFEKAGS